MDPKWTHLRKCKGTKWIKTLRTTYPYGLNDKINDDIKSTSNEVVDLNFPFLKQMYSIMWRTKYISTNSLNRREFVFNLNRYLI